MALHTPAADLGKRAANFSLPGVDGKTHTLSEYQNGKPLVIMFICNHCPYVKAIEDRLITLGNDCHKIDVNVVAICANDPDDYPDDSFQKMCERAALKKYSFPYLQDLKQTVAQEYGAVCTPDFFVYDSKGGLAYRGRLDDSWKEPSQVKVRELFDVVTALSNGQTHPLIQNQTPSMGCSIKWRKA